MYHDMLQEARNRHNDEAIRELEGIAPYPPPSADIRKLRIANQWAGALLGPPPGAAEKHLESMMRVVVSAPEYSLVDDYEFVHAPEFSAEVLLPLSSQELSAPRQRDQRGTELYLARFRAVGPLLTVHQFSIHIVESGHGNSLTAARPAQILTRYQPAKQTERLARKTGRPTPMVCG